jgi:hypothetical protein
VGNLKEDVEAKFVVLYRNLPGWNENQQGVRSEALLVVCLLLVRLVILP